jgi:hypothetical protein
MRRWSAERSRVLDRASTSALIAAVRLPIPPDAAEVRARVWNRTSHDRLARALLAT